MRKILVILLVLLLCGSLFFLFDERAEKQPEKSETVSTTYQIETTEKAVPTDTEETTAINETKLEIQPRSTFEIYYLDVGQGDAACVLCDGHAMLIDGGDRNKSDLMYSFLKSHSISKLDCVIASHPDADHIGGLAGALNYATTSTAYCTTDEHDTDTFRNFKKYLKVPITIPNPGDSFLLGSAKVSFLYPEAGHTATDNTSLALRIEYGCTSFLFVGDCETEDEYLLMNSGYDLRSNVLKIGHHGSASSTSTASLKMVSPDYAIISVGGDNTYGHPTEEVLQRLKDNGIRVLRTDMQGDIHCISDGDTVHFEVERNADADVFAAAGGYANFLTAQQESEKTADHAAETISANATGTDYVVNTNTGKFHYPWCSSVNQMKDSNKWLYTGTRDELINNGYKPCQRCNP